mgnify:CR=1 FL=1
MNRPERIAAAIKHSRKLKKEIARIAEDVGIAALAISKLTAAMPWLSRNIRIPLIIPLPQATFSRSSRRKTQRGGKVRIVFV